MVILILRWLSVPIVFIAVMGICILSAMWVVTLADGRCESMVGGACVESWHTTVVEWATYLGIVVACLTAPFLTSKVAPVFKRTTAGIVGAAGSAPVWTGYIATGWGDLLLPACLALVSSLVSLGLVWRHQLNRAVKESLG